jgi:hypothetical protein
VCERERDREREREKERERESSLSFLGLNREAAFGIKYSLSESFKCHDTAGGFKKT